MKQGYKLDYELEYITCNLCGSNDSKVYIERARDLYNGIEGEFNLVECKRCSFIYTNPRPTMDTIGYFYPDSAGYYLPEKEKERKNNYVSVIRDSILTNYFGYPFNKLPKLFDSLIYLVIKRRLRISHTPNYIKSGKLLDIGCSWGRYLQSMDELGWDVYGIEYNESAAKIAKERFGNSKIFHGTIEQYEFQEKSFNVINMNMVLEHIYHPKEILTKINLLLKENGQLIISVPDISGFEAKLYKEKFYGLQVPTHVNHFTPKTLRRVLLETGYEVEGIYHQSFDRDLVASAGYYKSDKLSKVLSNRFVRKFIVGPIVIILARLGKTSRMSIYARKKDGN